MKTAINKSLKPKRKVVLDEFEQGIENDVEEGIYSLISTEEFFSNLKKGKYTKQTGNKVVTKKLSS